ncbi:hypothetical protein L249_2472, partial [Ophiocordyceps polyrhachis-furcata BCC 54312]
MTQRGGTLIFFGARRHSGTTTTDRALKAQHSNAQRDTGRGREMIWERTHSSAGVLI